MFTGAYCAGLAVTFTGLSAFVWRVSYEQSDLSAVLLLPFAIMLFIAQRTLTRYVYLAWRRAVVLPTSPLSRILTGWLYSNFVALVFATVATLLLAWQALSGGVVENLVLLAWGFTAGFVFVNFEERLLRHLHRPFARATAMWIGTWVVAIPMILFLAWLSWAYTVYPGNFLEAGFQEALQIGIDRLPDRRGTIAEILAPIFAIDAGKLWVVVQAREFPIIGVVLSLDNALVGIILAKAVITLTAFVQAHVGVGDME